MDSLTRVGDAGVGSIGYTRSVAVPADQAPRPERAFERLYRRHVDEVYRYALAVLANSADAEDVTQTAFLNAYRAFQSGQRPDRPLNWLIAITHNVCRQRFRDAARRPREVVLEHDIAAADHHQDDGFRPEDIRRALSQLSFSQRSALALRELEGRSYKEIAEVLELTETAVETLIFRARRAFREQLEGTLTCAEAERAISRQLDGMLPRRERSGLRAHLRACPECSTLARRLRAQASALRGIAFLPLPPTLASFSAPSGAGLAGGAGAALGAGLGIKAVAVGAAALVAAGVGTEVVRHASGHPVRNPTTAVPVAAAADTVASRRSVAFAARQRTVGVDGRKRTSASSTGSASRPSRRVTTVHLHGAAEVAISSSKPLAAETADAGTGRSTPSSPASAHATVHRSGGPGAGPGKTSRTTHAAKKAGAGSSVKTDGAQARDESRVSKSDRSAAVPGRSPRSKTVGSGAPAGVPESPTAAVPAGASNTADPGPPADAGQPGNGNGNGNDAGEGNGQGASKAKRP
jgi:RNA polymerase sigma factor (sigma-70 family)